MTEPTETREWPAVTDLTQYRERGLPKPQRGPMSPRTAALVFFLIGVLFAPVLYDVAGLVPTCAVGILTLALVVLRRTSAAAREELRDTFTFVCIGVGLAILALALMFLGPIHATLGWGISIVASWSAVMLVLAAER